MRGTPNGAVGPADVGVRDGRPDTARAHAPLMTTSTSSTHLHHPWGWRQRRPARWPRRRDEWYTRGHVETVDEYLRRGGCVRVVPAAGPPADAPRRRPRLDALSAGTDTNLPWADVPVAIREARVEATAAVNDECGEA